jgi:hypothetical protein
MTVNTERTETNTADDDDKKGSMKLTTQDECQAACFY